MVTCQPTIPANTHKVLKLDRFRQWTDNYILNPYKVGNSKGWQFNLISTVILKEIVVCLSPLLQIPLPIHYVHIMKKASITLLLKKTT